MTTIPRQQSTKLLTTLDIEQLHAGNMHASCNPRTEGSPADTVITSACQIWLQDMHLFDIWRQDRLYSSVRESEGVCRLERRGEEVI